MILRVPFGMPSGLGQKKEPHARKAETLVYLKKVFTPTRLLQVALKIHRSIRGLRRARCG